MRFVSHLSSNRTDVLSNIDFGTIVIKFRDTNKSFFVPVNVQVIVSHSFFPNYEQFFEKMMCGVNGGIVSLFRASLDGITLTTIAEEDSSELVYLVDSLDFNSLSEIITNAVQMLIDKYIENHKEYNGVLLATAMFKIVKVNINLL